MRDLQFDDMHLFARVVELGTLSRIEKACAARLVHRSRHGLSLSPDELEGEFSHRAGEVRGLVKVASSTVVGAYQLGPNLDGLRERHPHLRVELEVSDRLTDMAQAGTPKQIEDLRSHTSITNSHVAFLNQGADIGRLATLVGDGLVKKKMLVPVLDKWVDCGPVPVYAVTLSSRHRLPKIKACIDYGAEWLGKGSLTPSGKK